MHSTVALPPAMTATLSSESPTNNNNNNNGNYSEFGWCVQSPGTEQDNYNENYIPNEGLGQHSTSQLIHPYYGIYPHNNNASSGHHHSHNHSHNHHHYLSNGSEVDDCCSGGGSGPEYGFGSRSRSPSSTTYVWDCPASNASPGPLTSPSQCNNNNNSNNNNSMHLGSGGGGYTGKPTVKRRNTANKKERRRTQSINNAFSELRDCIPNVPADTKLSKIKTLRLATSYIAYLSEVLSGDDPSGVPAFTAEISRKLARGDDKRKKELLIAELAGSIGGNGNSAVTIVNNLHNEKRKTKGRTGWPQHVWENANHQNPARILSHI